MPTREELEALPSAELHDRATRLAWRRLDVGFLWDLLKTIPEARAAAGDDERSETDIMRPLALLNDLVDADRGELADALRPLYVDYLLAHADDDDGEGGSAYAEPDAATEIPEAAAATDPALDTTVRPEGDDG
jgi:hypothetical protein